MSYADLRFLVDNALSPRFASALNALGCDTVHVRNLNMAAASDAEILQRASREERIVVSEDTDFGTLLARTSANTPSVILFRTSIKSPERLHELLAENLDTIAEDLRSGAIVVFEDRRIRVRRLPVEPDREQS